MIKHLDSKRIQNGLQNRKVTIKTFPGARIDDMKHYAVPTLTTKLKPLLFTLELTICETTHHPTC